MAKAAKALAGIRVEHDTHEAALIAALMALEDICEPNQESVVISAAGAFTLFQTAENLGWVDTTDKARRLLRRLGFRSAIQVADGVELDLVTLGSFPSRFRTVSFPKSIAAICSPSISPMRNRHRCHNPTGRMTSRLNLFPTAAPCDE